MGWLFVPALAGSSKASKLPSAGTTELCVTSSGTPMLRPSSWRGWKTRPWRRHLSGTTFSHSEACAGVGRWISSLPDCPASRTRLQASDVRIRTREPSGPRSSMPSEMLSRARSSSKTSRRSSSTSKPPSSAYELWVSSLLRLFEPRLLVWGLRTVVGESSSLLPTPSACSYGTNQGGSAGRAGQHARPSLQTLAGALLPTPRASANENRGTKSYGRKGGRALSEVVGSLLPTPAARDSKGANGPEHFARPRPHLGQLPNVVALLPTPTATDAKASGAAGYSTSSGRHSGTTLTDVVAGAATSGRTGKLNPRFSEWMLGLPEGWTSCE